MFTMAAGSVWQLWGGFHAGNNFFFFFPSFQFSLLISFLEERGSFFALFLPHVFDRTHSKGTGKQLRGLVFPCCTPSPECWGRWTSPTLHPHPCPALSAPQSILPPLRRCDTQIRAVPHLEVPHGFPPHPLAPLRPALLLLRDDGQGAGEVAGSFPGLRTALQQW